MFARQLLALVLLSACGAVAQGPGTDALPAAVLDADAAVRSVPDGWLACGDTNLASGWPTTTIYLPQVAAQCIVEAAGSGDPAQHAVYGRTGDGGITGSVIRVDGPGSVVIVNYAIDPQGGMTSTQTACSSLELPPLAPPVCARP